MLKPNKQQIPKHRRSNISIKKWYNRKRNNRSKRQPPRHTQAYKIRKSLRILKRHILLKAGAYNNEYNTKKHNNHTNNTKTNTPQSSKRNNRSNSNNRIRSHYK